MRTLRAQAKVQSGSFCTSNVPRAVRAWMPSLRKEYGVVLGKEELSVPPTANLVTARLHAETRKTK